MHKSARSTHLKGNFMSNNTTADVTGIFSLDTNRLVGLAAKGSPDVTYLAGQDTPTSGIPLTVTLTSVQGVEFTAGDTVIPIGSPPARIVVSGRTADAVASTPLVAPFKVGAKITINRVSGSCAVKQSGALVEIAIYNASRGLVVSTERRECPEVGIFEFAFPATTLPAGDYFAVLYCNHGTPTFGVETRYGCYTAPAVLPLPATLGALSPATTAPALTIWAADDYAISNFESVESTRIAIFGGSAAKIWGISLDSGKIAYTTDAGATVTSVMNKPSVTGADLKDILEIGGKLYMLYGNLRMFVSSDLTAGAIWTEITCPATPGLRHSVGQARPYGFALYNDYIFVGEYTSEVIGETAADPTDPSGPRILKYGPLSGAPAWGLSKEFANARHIHSFYSVNGTKMWVTIGDAGYGADIGMWRLTAVTAGAPDTWTKWTSPASPYTDHYPVDVIDVINSGSANGVYATSDRPGKHVLFAKMTGTAGAFNWNAQLFRQNSVASETVRSIVYDAGTKNLIWFSAETTDPAIYCSPPPYTESFRVSEFSSPFLSRSIIQGGYVLIYNIRFKLPKFSWQ